LVQFSLAQTRPLRSSQRSMSQVLRRKGGGPPFAWAFARPPRLPNKTTKSWDKIPIWPIAAKQKRTVVITIDIQPWEAHEDERERGDG